MKLRLNIKTHCLPIILVQICCIIHSLQVLVCIENPPKEPKVKVAIVGLHCGKKTLRS